MTTPRFSVGRMAKSVAKPRIRMPTRMNTTGPLVFDRYSMIRENE